MGFSCFEDESKRMCCSPKVVNGSRDILRRSFSCLRISITVLHEERSNASSFSFCEKSGFFSPENRLPPKFAGKSSCSQQSNFPLGLNPPIDRTVAPWGQMHQPRPGLVCLQNSSEPLIRVSLCDGGFRRAAQGSPICPALSMLHLYLHLGIFWSYCKCW